MLNNKRKEEEMGSYYERIAREAKTNFIGMEFTAKEFKYAFNAGMQALNTLVKFGVFIETGKTLNGNVVYKVA